MNTEIIKFTIYSAGLQSDRMWARFYIKNTQRFGWDWNGGYISHGKEIDTDTKGVNIYIIVLNKIDSVCKRDCVLQEEIVTDIYVYIERQRHDLNQSNDGYIHIYLYYITTKYTKMADYNEPSFPNIRYTTEYLDKKIYPYSIAENTYQRGRTRSWVGDSERYNCRYTTQTHNQWNEIPCEWKTTKMWGICKISQKTNMKN